VILWYIGHKGLKESCVKFYQENVLSHFLNNVNMPNRPPTFWLVDLTAWGAFTNTKLSIYNANSCCDFIEQLSNPHIKCISSSTIFEKMLKLHPLGVEYFEKELQREFLKNASMAFPTRGITIKEIFPCDNTIFRSFQN